MSGSTAVAVALVVALGSVVQGITGFGFALVSMPLLATLLGVSDALVIQTLLGLVSNSTTGWTGRRSVLRPTATRLLLATAAGMPVGLLLLSRVPARGMKVLVGVTVAAVAIALARRLEVRADERAVDLGAGFVSGVLGTSIGTNGPPIVIALASRRLDKAAQRATMGTVFALGNAIALTLFAATGRFDRVVVIGTVVSLPGLLLAWAAGDRVFSRIDQKRYESSVIGLLLASAGVAVVSALVG